MAGKWILVAALMAFAGTLVSCDRGKAANRREEVLIMASEEVASITDAKERLTRQLNIAELQIAMAHKPDAAKTLATARDGLTAASAKDMDDLGRMSGWVSISELARAAGDKALAGKACDDGRELLSSIKPEAARCEYVLGQAEEIRQLRGQEDAARLVVKGGQWAVHITDEPYRRRALVAFMDQLLTYEDYAGARQVIRQEADAIWRADTLTAMARIAESEVKAEATNAPMAAREAAGPVAIFAAPASRHDQHESFGKQLDYESNYQRR